jgi:hypothetical protein
MMYVVCKCVSVYVRRVACALNATKIWEHICLYVCTHSPVRHCLGSLLHRFRRFAMIAHLCLHVATVWITIVGHNGAHKGFAC